MNEVKTSKPNAPAIPALTRQEILIGVLIVVGVALITGFAESTQAGRLAFSVLFALIGGVMGTVVVASVVFLYDYNNRSKYVKTYIVPNGFLVVLSRYGRRVATSQGPEFKIDETKGESFQAIDLRERPTPVRHKCKSQDRKDVEFDGFIIWRVTNVESFLDRTAKAEDVMGGVVKSAMMSVVGRYEIKLLSSRLDALPYEIASVARNNLSPYGIGLVSLFLTSADLQGSDKSEADKEADRLRKIGEVAKEVGERTLEYIEKMEHAKSGKGG